MTAALIPVYRAPHEPTDSQIAAGNYPKRRIAWRGLTIAIENDAGTVRRGKSRAGVAWETRMAFPYGYFVGSKGMDGDGVDVTVGPNLDAPTAYIVRARRAGKWDEYDEDKCFVGFDSEDDARAAFLASYSDPRFFGPIAAMPADEFAAKVKAAKQPTMIKALLFIVRPNA